jgi:hypothetical protein
VIRRHLSYANVTATLALLFAMAGGAAYAVDRINSHDILNGSIRSVDLKNRKAVRGADVKPNGLTGRQVDEGTLKPGPIARVVGNETGPCVLSLAPRACVSTPLAMSRPSRVLVIATGNQESLSGHGQASCRIAIDGLAEPLAVTPGEAATDNTDATATNGFARTFVSKDALAAGKHTVALSCKRLLGGVQIDSPTIAAVAIGAG